MKTVLIGMLERERTVQETKDALDGASVSGQPIQVSVDHRALPYLAHKVVAWVDGPPSSNVVAVLSCAHPKKQQWRRFALSRTGPGRYEIDCFATPFNNAEAPLSPGIPPSTSRKQ